MVVGSGVCFLTGFFSFLVVVFGNGEREAEGREWLGWKGIERN